MPQYPKVMHSRCIKAIKLIFQQMMHSHTKSKDVKNVHTSNRVVSGDYFKLFVSDNDVYNSNIAGCN